MERDLIIIGASGFGREVAWLVERINAVESTWNLLGFIDDNVDIQNQEVGGYAVLGTCECVANYPDAYFVCAIGAAQVRKTVIERLGKVNYATLIDPSVMISNRVSIGEGTIICAGTILTVDIQIGKHVIINLDCTVGHDAVIHDYVTLYPSVNISGITDIGECSEMGTGSQLIQKINVGPRSIVGAGAVVVKSIVGCSTYVGIPCKKLGGGKA